MSSDRVARHNSTVFLSVIAYQTPTTIVIPLSEAVRTQQTSLRWRQLKNDGKNYDEWAIDHIRITSTHIRTHVVEFDMCMTCGANYTNSTDSSAVELQFSSNYGRLWQPVHRRCWPTDPGCVQSLVKLLLVYVLCSTILTRAVLVDSLLVVIHHCCLTRGGE